MKRLNKHPRRVLLLPSIENLPTISAKFAPKYSIVGGQFRHISFIFENQEIRILFKGTDIREFDYVWLSSHWEDRDLAYAISIYLDSVGVPHTKVAQSGSKIVDQVLYTLNGIPTPATYFSTRKSISTTAIAVLEHCGFPAIVKDVFGSRGRYSKLINSRRNFEIAFKKLHPSRRFMFQKFVPNDYDWGVLVVYGKAVSAEKSYRAPREFRNNACRSAKEIFVPVAEVPDNIISIAVNAAKVLGLSWSRSDIIVNKETGECLLLEVNRFPGTTFGSAEVDAAVDYLGGKLEGCFGK